MLEGRFWELALIFVLALVVFGPERLPGLARTVGQWVGRAQAIVKNLTQRLEQELAVEDMRKTADTARRAARDPLHAAAKTTGTTAAEAAPETVKHDQSAG